MDRSMHQHGIRYVGQGLEKCRESNSLVERFSTGEQVGVVLPDVSMHWCGASTSGFEHLVTVLAEHPSGELVVGSFVEVVPNPTSEWTFNVDRGGWTTDKSSVNGRRDGGRDDGWNVPRIYIPCPVRDPINARGVCRMSYGQSWSHGLHWMSR